LDNLDFYSQIEELIPFDEQIFELYKIYQIQLQELASKSVIDIGCGNGKFAKLLMDTGIDTVGVDLSAKMAARAQRLGVNARCIDICDIKNEKYDAATAVFDVLNYIPDESLDRFFSCIANLLNKNSFFLADINTIHGFAEVADGDARFFDTSREIFISARYENSRLESEFILFEKDGDRYRRSTSKITQYYHDKNRLKKIAGFKLEKTLPIRLFSEKIDKELLLFKKI